MGPRESRLHLLAGTMPGQEGRVPRAGWDTGQGKRPEYSHELSKGQGTDRSGAQDGPLLVTAVTQYFPLF